jgi:signal transduction histidine kinase
MSWRVFPGRDLSLMRAEVHWPERLWHVSVILLIVFVPWAIIESVAVASRVPVPELYVLANDPTRIYYVIPGGGAEAAGVRAGDTILRLNGLDFDANNLPRTIHNLHIGQSAIFTLRRPDGEQVDLAVPLVPAAKITRNYLIRDSLVALIFWSVSALLLLRRFQRREVRLLFLLAQAVALGALFPSMPFIIWYHGALTWLNVSGTSGLMSAPLLFHFHSTFPVVLGSPRQRRWVLGSLYGLTLAAAICWILINYGWLPYVIALGFLIYVAGVFAAAVLVLLFVYLRRATPDGRRRLRVILVGNLVAGGPPALLYILPLITLGYPLMSDALLALCLAAAPAAYAYATMRHNLFGIEHLLNRALVYALIALGICALYVGPLLALDRLFPYGWLWRTLVMAGLTLLVALAFDGTRRRVQQIVDRLFYGGWYDYPRVVETISVALAHSLDWHELAEVLTRQVPGLMQLRGAQLQMGEQVTAPLEAALQPQLQFPLEGQGQAQALWIVGPRRDGDELSATDQRILKTLADQANIALSNVRLVQTLRRQLDEILTSRKTLTRLEHQLLRMREEERRRLARDLHDGPIQTLVGLNLQLGLLATRPEVGETTTPLACALSSIRAEVRTLLSDLRQVCANLRPPMLDTLGLGAALRALAQEWSAQHGLPVHLDLAPDAMLQTLPGEVTVNLYRVVQETLSNVARHAAAHQVSLSLQWAGPIEDLCLTIHDDGQGFAPAVLSRPSDHGHFGLAAMQERVALIGGLWQLESSPGQGTNICVTWRPPAKTQAETSKTLA